MERSTATVVDCIGDAGRRGVKAVRLSREIRRPIVIRVFITNPHVTVAPPDAGV